MLTPSLRRFWSWARAYDDEATRLEAALSIFVVVAMIFAALSLNAAVTGVRTRYIYRPDAARMHAGPVAPDTSVHESTVASPSSDSVDLRR